MKKMINLVEDMGKGINREELAEKEERKDDRKQTKLHEGKPQS